MSNIGEQSSNMFGSKPSALGGSSMPTGGGAADKQPADAGNGGSSSGAFTRSAPKAAARAAGRRARAELDPRLLPPNFDVNRGLSRMKEFTVTEESVMEKREAGKFMADLMAFVEIDSADEGVRMAFMEGLYLSMALNGTSTMQPGRAVVVVDGVEFKILDFIQKAGPNWRRFARANADNIRNSVYRILEKVAANDLNTLDLQSAIRRVANERGIQRFPSLIADVSDYCSELSQQEFVAVNASKGLVLSNTTNAPDSVLAMGKAITADGFSSAAGKDIDGMGGDAAPTRR